MLQAIVLGGEILMIHGISQVSLRTSTDDQILRFYSYKIATGPNNKCIKNVKKSLKEV